MTLDAAEIQRLWQYLTPAEKKEITRYTQIIERVKNEWKPSLQEFIREAWHVLEPTSPYVHGWHIDAICEHLVAVTFGQIRDLVINMPPRHAKSLIVAVFWPCWVWTFAANKRWIFASYGQDLSTRDSRKCRQLIQSPWYKKHFGERFQLIKDQNQKTRFENTRLGYRIATSVGGIGTGEGGDFLVVDDPHNVLDGESNAIREEALRWWDETMSTRGNNPKTFAKVIVQQRVHALDLSGHVIAKGGYTHLCLPAEFEQPTADKPRIITSIGWTDPRQEDGELLWPQHFDRESLENIKRSLGTYGAAGQLQQRPAPREGGLIKLAWFKYYNEQPAAITIAYIIQSWDTAFKTASINDYSVCTTWAVVNGGFYLLDRFKGKLEYPALKRQMIALYRQFKPVTVLIEDKASGQSLIQEMSKPFKDDIDNIIYRLPIKPFKAEVDKVTRVSACTTTLETNVWLPQNAEWKQDYLDNLSSFPNAAHDDDVDSTTQALIYLALQRGQPPRQINLDIMSR